MAFSEGLSDTGELTGRGSPVLRGAITGGGTFLGGVFHTLPFLIPGYQTAIAVAIVIVAVELLLLGWGAIGSSTSASSIRSYPSRSAARSSPASAQRSESSPPVDLAFHFGPAQPLQLRRDRVRPRDLRQPLSVAQQSSSWELGSAHTFAS